MLQPQPCDFKERLHQSLKRTADFPSVHVNKQQPVYLCGDPARSVYFIESGQIKLLMLSPEGKECLLDIHTEGDIFGELCLARTEARQETATAMGNTTLKRIPSAAFLLHLAGHSLVDGFVQYLANRVGEQQQVISHLITVDSEHRLGETLLMLARKLGLPDPRSTRIEQKITHEELSEMVGTTRPRITAFMHKFRALGLVETNPQHFLIVKERKLLDYLTGVGRTLPR
ncbi:MAG TPA: Crp/Fnr family transcriptional regulator [Pyrinomonadaceae bacterium]|nr:Crp/Fnr family transcriptional regulator [Pyrinomonadaceae bacterium]